MGKADTRINVFHWTSGFPKLTGYPQYCGFLCAKIARFCHVLHPKEQNELAYN